LAATGKLRRPAALLATVAVVASVVAGCGGGGSGTVKTPTQSGGPPTQPGGQETSAPAFVGKIEKTAPEQIAHVCLAAKAKGNDAAFADFKKGYALAFPDETLSPKRVFDEILKHCD
jgi:hypothetical protein